MKLDLSDPENIKDWVYSVIEAKWVNAPYAAIAISDDSGKRMAGCVYMNYHEHDIEMVFAAAHPRWCIRDALRVFFAYPFIQLGVSRVTAICAASNERARRFIQGIGFVHEGRLRKGLDGHEDAHIYSMLREECRWINRGNYEEQRTTAAAA